MRDSVHVVLKLLRFIQFLPVEAACVGAERYLYSLGERELERSLLRLDYLGPVSLAAIRHIRAYRDCRYPIDSALRHLLYLRRGQSVAVTYAFQKGDAAPLRYSRWMVNPI